MTSDRSTNVPLAAREVGPAGLTRSAGRQVSARHEDFTSPLLIGYLQRQLLVTDQQVEAVKCEFATYARKEGYSMGFTYVEYPGRWPAAFEALIEAVKRYEITAVVLPSLLHFGALDPSAGFSEHFEDATGARVLVVNVPPTRSEFAAHPVPTDRSRPDLSAEPNCRLARRGDRLRPAPAVPCPVAATD